MNNPVYVGIENEFQLMEDGREINFTSRIWEKLIQGYDFHYFKVDSSAMRNRVGNSIYVDIDEPEVATHPVRIEPGFVQKAADSLYLARKELVEFVSPDNLRLIGYSMHWNISDVVGNNKDYDPLVDKLMMAMFIPYSLFALNPLSCGINMRIKDDDDNTRRLELLGDHVEDEDQIKAFLLFYAASVVNLNANVGMLPMYPIRESIDGYVYNNHVKNGRTQRLRINANLKNGKGSNWRVITMQDYLEIYFEFFRRGIEELGTPEEVKNLEDFVYGRKKLEVDKREKYEFIKPLKRKDDLKLDFDPSICVDPANYSEDREIPTPMGRFLGRIANTHYKGLYAFDPKKPLSKKIKHIETMSWSYLTFDYDTPPKSINGIGNIDFIAEVLSETPTELQDDVFDELIEFLRNWNQVQLIHIPSSELSPNDYSHLFAKITVASSCLFAKITVASSVRFRMERKIGNITVENFDIESRIKTILQRDRNRKDKW